VPGTSATPLAPTRDTNHGSGESGVCRWNLSWFRIVITVNGTATTKIADLKEDPGPLGAGFRP